MRSIDGQATSNDYTAACTLSEVWNSNGGYFVIGGNDVYMQLQWGPQGTLQWTNEVHVPVGNGELRPGTIGVRCRSYAAGKSATITAGLAAEAEPPIIIGTPSTASVQLLTGVTGVVAGNGTITAGSGFTVVRSSAGVYVVTFSSALASLPIVLLTLVARTAFEIIANPAPTTTGFGVQTLDSVFNPADSAFSFFASPAT